MQTPPPDAKRAVDLLMQLLAIPGTSGGEGKVVNFITGRLRRAGIAATAMTTDQAHRRSSRGGEIGNLIVKLPGTGALKRQPRRMLMAHMDTVPLCVGCKPVLRGDWIRPAKSDTALGADDRSGVAAVMTAVLELKRLKLPHPPLTLLFAVQEEIGLIGARHVAVGKLGKPHFAFNFDGGSPAKLTIGATGAYRLTIDVHGIAAHAGVAPQLGVSAITIAALAIAQLKRQGWLGKVSKGAGGTTNIGVFNAGDATNVVTAKAALRAEVRSHNKRFRKQILDAFITAFKEAAGRISNAAGEHGSVDIDARLDYEAFALKGNEPCVRIAEAAVRAAGAEPLCSICDGGLDANMINAHGIPTVTLGAGAVNPHMLSEALDVKAFLKACGIALSLASASER
jgi:tripeptide aminopeptidase